MKKNLISVIILALVFANFVLTALLLFTVLPQTKKANKMIEDVCAAIDLELNSGGASGPSNVAVADQEIFGINGGEKLTVSFGIGDDGKAHHLIAEVSLTLNKKSDAYNNGGVEMLTAQESVIKSTIDDVIYGYTIEDYNGDKNAIYNKILKELQRMYGGDFIVSVNFSGTLAD